MGMQKAKLKLKKKKKKTSIEQVLGKVSRKLRHPSLSQSILNSSSVADAGASPSFSNTSVTSIIHGLRLVK